MSAGAGLPADPHPSGAANLGNAAHTADQPEPDHASIELIAALCTSCNLCVTECPTWCIELDYHIEEVAGSGRGRARKVKVLDSLTIAAEQCMDCGICVDVCPFDALVWNPTPTPPVLG